MDQKLWWKKPLRVVQTNLQVKDTRLMDPEKIAAETEAMAGNVLVMNVGGIYAWYPSKVRYHHINEYLPKEGDLLAELIDACHRRNIRVVARFDFSKTDDAVFQQRPDWFIREPDRSPRIYGATRPGDWSILYTTCINAGYRNEEVAIPVLEEVIDNYDIDGIFFNAPHYEYCCCESCRRKYQQYYGKPLPIDLSKVEENTTFASKAGAGLEPDFASRCVRDNMDKIYGAVKRKAPDMPLILYYGLYRDNLNDRYATADMICTESQDVLSRGWKDIPPIWHPVLSMKMGRTMEEHPSPFGIIHSCPGMDWRHTGLPTAEYLFWMSGVVAGGGQLWHSITGFPDTISDKRILHSLTAVNKMIEKIENEMDGAEFRSDVLLYWDGGKAAEGWADGLTNCHFQFDLAAPYQLTSEKLARYPVVIVPNGGPLDSESLALLKTYAENGGKLIFEGNSSDRLIPAAGLLGISDEISTSEYLAASYWQFEPVGDVLRGTEFTETPLLAHRGQTAYVKPLCGTQVLATLVPPFAPLNAVGAPPERASMLVSHTDLPLCTSRIVGSGTVVALTFGLGELMNEYKLAEHSYLCQNLVDFLLGDDRTFRMELLEGIETVCYQKKNLLLVHLLNGIGKRPLMNNILCTDVSFTTKLPKDKSVGEVLLPQSGQIPVWSEENGYLRVTIPRLSFWETVVIRLNERS